MALALQNHYQSLGEWLCSNEAVHYLKMEENKTMKIGFGDLKLKNKNKLKIESNDYKFSFQGWNGILIITAI
jgi:hypothetical protein